MRFFDDDSDWFLQSNQFILWINYRILYTKDMPYDVGRRKVSKNNLFQKWNFNHYNNLDMNIFWADGKDIKKPIKVSAPEYADYLMTYDFIDSSFLQTNYFFFLTIQLGAKYTWRWNNFSNKWWCNINYSWHLNDYCWF